MDYIQIKTDIETDDDVDSSRLCSFSDCRQITLVIDIFNGRLLRHYSLFSQHGLNPLQICHWSKLICLTERLNSRKGALE